MENVWKSNARYNQNPEEGNIFELKNNKLRISIHHYVGCGDAWFLTSPDLCISCYNLETTNFEEAVEFSKKIVKHKVNNLVEQMMNFCDCENNIVVRY